MSAAGGGAMTKALDGIRVLARGPYEAGPSGTEIPAGRGTPAIEIEGRV